MAAIAGAAASVLLLTGGNTMAQAEGLDEVREFHIEAQSLDAALIEFSEQADLQLVVQTELVAGRQSPGVNGALTSSDALVALLNDSELSFTAVGDDTVAVSKPDEGGDSELGNGRTAGATPKPVMMAQAAVEQSQASRRTETESDKDEIKRPLEEIIVTGTNIRGMGISVGSKLTVVDRDEIDAAGFSTAQQIIQSLPQNFNGGINEDTFRFGENAVNITGSTSVNLRGLGAGTTLTLVNGRRLPVGGSSGNFADISNIPAALIERVEILADGSSSIYGTDAIAGVVNFILRDDFEGAETRLRFGTVTEGGLDEYHVSQLFGKNWSSGNLVIGFEYYDRDSLGFEDKPFSASSDLTPFGGGDFRTPFSVPSNILDPGTGQPAFAIPADQDGTNLTPGDLIPIPPGEPNLFDPNLGRDLLLEQSRHNVLLSINQEFGEGIELFAQGQFNDKDISGTELLLGRPIVVPSSNAFFVDPFGGSSSITLQFNENADFPRERTAQSRSYAVNFGANIELGVDWELRTFGAYGKVRETEFASSSFANTAALNSALEDSDPATAFNPFGDGSFQQNPNTIAGLIQPDTLRVTSDVWTANVVLDGRLLSLPGGDLRAAIGGNYNYFFFENVNERLFQGEVLSAFENAFRRRAKAVFGEAFIPIVGESNSLPTIERLLVTASVRYEDFDDVGDTTNPKVGLLWTPFDSLDIRGTYGTSFRAPDLFELFQGASRHALVLQADPQASGGQTLTLVRFGNDPDLKPETARTWTIGFDYTPSTLPELNIDFTYYNIEFENRIDRVASGFSALIEGDRLNLGEPIIVRNPSQALIDEVCNGPDPFQDRGLGPCATTPVGAVVDARLVNTAITKTDGIDFNVRYGWDTASMGRFDIHLNGTYILSLDEAFSSTLPLSNLVDTVGNPIDFHSRNSISWSDGAGLSASIFVNYADSYTDNRNSPERKIDSWVTADLAVAYNMNENLRSIGLNDVQFSLNVQNVFETDPPFVANIFGGANNGAVAYDQQNASPLGRFISFNLIKAW